MTPKLMQLYAMRAQLEAIISAEEAELPVVSGCPHPEEKRRSTTVMGGEPEYLCLACGAVVKGTV